MSNSDAYLRGILSVVARQAIPPDQLASQVGVGKTKLKQIEAYNLCDGSLTQGEVAKQLGIDSGNFSKTIARWSDDGLIVRTEVSGQMRPVHLYPISAAVIKKFEKGDPA
ncbi:MarR family transcriptional regulator [Aurantiacibacter gangjinensis]|uniref:HTH marR-type domain-containing protein n=1 Tax=Aurantiacibacter gangjinensis TaxID=502682 RepID=A0A0G9MPR7_9SPHN|nr:helix-turn-helix domain-containing protein [Aurantiacibacter gangjinensis]KLE32717.1 hypothetical protein AAW01_01295 [Aurantiacibacter gangjinensis]